MNIQIRSNQYGFMPAKTYWYLFDTDNNTTFNHKKQKWQRKPSMQLWEHAVKTENQAISIKENLV